MRKTRKSHQKTLNPLLFSMLISVCSLFILVLVSSLILMRCENPSGNVGIATIMLFPLSGSVCGIATTLYKGENGVKESLIAALIISALLCIIGLVVLKGALSPSVLINCATFILSSAILSYLARPKAKRHRRYR